MISLAKMILNVGGITFLLAGTTVAARIPRLTRVAWWRIFAWVLFLCFAALYVLLVDAPTRCWLGFSRGGPTTTTADAVLPTIITLLMAAGSAAFSALTWYVHRPPDWLVPLLRGTRPLTIPVSIAVVLLIAYRMILDHSADRSLWPLILSSGIFLYLWWLSIRLFDLIFVWHRYTRGAVLQRHLSRMRPGRNAGEANPEQRPEAASAS
jgi:hypothetical protein